ncbi:hypothetical protein DEU73_107362 [Paenibacillus taichungensis]|nr:hypothetical protein DEU73_107362 [Paenibacillus taichungensis]
MAENVGSSIGVLVQWIKNNKREFPEDMAEIVMHQLLSNYNRFFEVRNKGVFPDSVNSEWKLYYNDLFRDIEIIG